MSDFWLEQEQERTSNFGATKVVHLDVLTGMTFDERMAYYDSFSSVSERLAFERKQAEDILEATAQGRLASAIASATLAIQGAIRAGMLEQ